jgi:hypothetical protein
VGEWLKPAVLKTCRKKSVCFQSLAPVLVGAIWHDLGGVGTKLGNDLGNKFGKVTRVVNAVSFGANSGFLPTLSQFP